MATTTYVDASIGARAIGARTDAAGDPATDLSSSEDRIINDVVTEGYLTDGAFEVSADSPASMDVIVGSGTSGADVYVVGGDDDGQHNYLCRLDTSGVTVTLDAADASNGRIDQIWLVVADNTYDSGGLSLPRIGYRKGDASASPAAPGEDAVWKAAVLLASVTVDAGVSSVDAGDITDQRSSASLNAELQGPGSGLDADTVDGVQASALAKLAGGTFTGAVTFESGLNGKLSDDAVGHSAASSSWPTGLAWERVTSAAWPRGGIVLNFNSGTAAANWQMLIGGTDGEMYIRRESGGGGWRDWQTILTAQDLSKWEVDNSTEVASTSLTTSLATVASVNLTIPSGWGSWKCEAYATYAGSRSPGTTSGINSRVVIDGTAQQTKEVLVLPGQRFGDSVGGRRTGMTTTGSRTVALQAAEIGDNLDLNDIYLYARAVRTS